MQSWQARVVKLMMEVSWHDGSRRRWVDVRRRRDAGMDDGMMQWEKG
jgi:hypothetical protein